ncbi:hypothetical protein ES705_29993 [subsurface metagenome]
MKCLILICILCTLILPMTSAQSASIGAKIGGGLASFGGSDWENALDWIGGDNKVRLGFTIGMFLNFKINEWFAIQPEFIYSLTGGAYYYYESFFFGDVDGKITINTLELPILLMPRFRAGKGEIRIFAGPDLIIILGDIETKEKTSLITLSVEYEPDHVFVFGIKGGIGYAHPLSEGAFVVDFGYTRSLTDIFEDDNTAINHLMLTIGYQIGF